MDQKQGAGHNSILKVRYSPYGLPTPALPATPLLFAGQYLDTETGFYYLRARYYDPSTAQFLSRDPADATTGTSYSYAANDPINAVDPTGQSWWNPFSWTPTEQYWFGAIPGVGNVYSLASFLRDIGQGHYYDAGCSALGIFNGGFVLAVIGDWCGLTAHAGDYQNEHWYGPGSPPAPRAPAPQPTPAAPSPRC
jgi:RHS repeat-associated protein